MLDQEEEAREHSQDEPDGIAKRSANRIPRLRSRGRANREMLLQQAREMLPHVDPPLKFSDVFAAAGVSRGSAYRIYDGIDDLMQDLAAEWMRDLTRYLVDADVTTEPETWQDLVDWLIERGAEFWFETHEVISHIPRIQAKAPVNYGSAIRELSEGIATIHSRYFEIPTLEGWLRRLAFCLQLADLACCDALRAEGRMTTENLRQMQRLCRVYLEEHLPQRLEPRR